MSDNGHLPRRNSVWRSPTGHEIRILDRFYIGSRRYVDFGYVATEEAFGRIKAKHIPEADLHRDYEWVRGR